MDDPQRFERHIFVCINDRGAGNPKGCCASKGGAEVAEALKVAAHQRGLKGRVRVNKAGCLDACQDGVSAVVYPAGIWYRHITLADVDEIVERTLLRGEIVDRLLSPTPPRRAAP